MNQRTSVQTSNASFAAILAFGLIIAAVVILTVDGLLLS